MIDLHTHILPDVDDGSSSLENSLIMADMAVKSGVRMIAATSHGCSTHVNLEKYWDAYRQLKNALREEKNPLQLVPGMEIFMTEDALAMIQKKNYYRSTIQNIF